MHVAADFGPYGTRRDEAVAKALAEDGRELVRTGSPYAVAPGRVRKADGEPFRVFTPFRRAWAEHGWRAAGRHRRVHRWAGWTREQKDGARARCASRTTRPLDAELPDAGEQAAHEQWAAFLDDAVAALRHRPRPAGQARAPRGCRCTSSTG